MTDERLSIIMQDWDDETLVSVTCAINHAGRGQARLGQGDADLLELPMLQLATFPSASYGTKEACAMNSPKLPKTVSVISV